MTTTEQPARTVPPTARFWDRIAERYAKQPVADEAAYQEKLRITRDILRPDMDVLEFGCGTGSTALVHAPYVRKILAVDLSPKMIEIARRKAATASCANVDFRCAAFEDFVAADESFDVILGLSILHLLADPELAIRRIHAMLKPGGVFVSSTVCLGDSLSIFKVIGPIGHFFGLLPLLRVFTTRQLVDSLRDAGFSIEHQWQPGKNKGVFIVARKAA